MYVGLTGVLLAHAMWRGSWRALLPVAGFVAVVDRVQIAAEEAALRERFGDDYEAYLAAVPRWLDLRSFQRR
jgi:protein-S-isoprenylcysteine O-methyltransferase Ste14